MADNKAQKDKGTNEKITRCVPLYPRVPTPPHSKSLSLKKFVRAFILIGLLSLAVYGTGRVYFRVTGGFREKHITSEFAYNPLWQTRELSRAEQNHVGRILSQPFNYLGKGCQSYVFTSDDGQYVLKFVKYQRFRPQFYIRWFAFLPPVDTILQEKLEKKHVKLDNLFSSWKIAFDNLQNETGLVYVHLNKSAHLETVTAFYDKIGLKHVLDMDEYEFLIQKRAVMLCPTLDAMMADGREEEAKALLTELVQMILSEYHRGLADNDHALMQNTGVFDGHPIHVDVGQFVVNEAMKNPENYHQELFNKTYKFRLWLKEAHPILLAHLDGLLQQEMGDKFFALRHIPKVRD